MEDTPKNHRRSEKSWDDLFTNHPDVGAGIGAEDGARLAEAAARHQDELLHYPNVVGVGLGLRSRGGRPTADPALVVYVTEKLPVSALPPDGVLPLRVDDVDIDVVGVGELEALPS